MTASRGFIAALICAAILAVCFHTLRLPGAWLSDP
jgi:hypothetical protein